MLRQSVITTDPKDLIMLRSEITQDHFLIVNKEGNRSLTSRI